MARIPTSLKRRRGVTLVEVMVASLLGVMVSATAISSAVYYQITTAKNDRLASVANMIRSEMELIQNQTWMGLSSPDTTPPERVGIFPPGGPSSTGTARGTWPARTGPFTRYQAYSRTFTSTGPLNPQFQGLTGTLRVFYTPFVVTHTGTGRDGATLLFDVNYYKVEVVVELDRASRIRPWNASQPQDTWAAMTVISELGGRSDAEFTQRTIELLRSRQRVSP